MRAWLYDRAFKPFTVRWYRSVLESQEPGSKLLDIGVATAGSIVSNASVVMGRDLFVHGIDIDPDYVQRARSALAKAGLAQRVTVELQSIYDHKGGPYDAAYFGASFMLMPDPGAALRHVQTLLRPGGRVYFTQTFEEKPNALLEKVKPLLVKVTTIDFGRVTYEQDFLDIIHTAGIRVVENTTLGGLGRARSYRRVVGVAADPA